MSKAKTWSMPGDPCPRCNGTKTIMEGFTNPVARTTDPKRPFVRTSPPSYTMRCCGPECRYEERRVGLPGS
jgi:hypothetical protein